MKIGTYAVEQDYSHYISYAAKTVLAIIGTASKGPIGEVVECTSAQDLVNKFGPVAPQHLGLYAGQYFLSQSSKLYYIRVAKGAYGADAEVVGEDTDGNTLTDALHVVTIEPGTFYNGCSITIAESTQSDGILTYDFTFKANNSRIIETVKGIKFEDIKIGYRTKYIKVDQMNPNTTKLTPGEYTLGDGSDGIEDIFQEYISAANALKAESIDMNLLATPGVSEYSVISEMLQLAEYKGDCLYLVDPPEGYEPGGVVDWHNGNGDTAQKLDSSYGALYYDWVTIYDSYNRISVNVPPSVVVAASYAYSDRTSEIWYAPAGLTRGLIRGALSSTTKLNKSTVETLYSNGNCINSIYEDPQVGLVIWGQKTLQRDDTALNRVNVRRLLNYLKRVITAACNYLTFEPNDRITWNSFEMKLQPVLQDIQNKRGLYEYRIIKGDTIVTEDDIDNYRMPCMILVRPTKAAEEIPIYFSITSTGADFNEVLESNGIVVE